MYLTIFEEGDLDPKKWGPQTWGLTPYLLIGKRTELLERRMAAPAIVKGFAVLESRPCGLGGGLKGLFCNAGSFEALEKLSSAALSGHLLDGVGWVSACSRRNSRSSTPPTPATSA